MEPSEKSTKTLDIAALRRFPRSHAVAAGSLVASLCLLFMLFPSKDASATRDLQETLTLPLDRDAPLSSALSLEAESAEEPETALELALIIEEEPPAAAERPWNEYEVKSGDSLALLFRRAGLSERDLYELLNQSPEARALRRIMPGHSIAFQIEDDRLEGLRYTRSRTSSLEFLREDGSFVAQEVERQPDVHLAYRQATINSSLFLAGQRAGLAHNLIMELANIFGWDVDFALDIRRGDSFNLLYEELYLDGERIGTGGILAAEFTNRGRTFRAVRYTHENGSTHYYTPDGNSMRREFLRTPVEFARISSHFNPNRRHPILHTIRAHRGTDYAAPTGTPIRAAGDGRVVHAGRKGGYGTTVVIQHGQTYQTLYAHMNNLHRGIRNGVRVRQGQTIGYVGSTGMATGPHLHYEFLVNGVHRNPVTVDLPQASSIGSGEMDRFERETGPILARLAQHHLATELAMSDDELNVN
ncbi:OapA family protein [Marinimicrobium alkaliphilum]|uniref:OapA family protein n=1 Tax=Marinimicrobium alkaliphilum TaxID=2202654 RepID=UPI000DB93844|nr:peptidoglycan DD-metalloendopeptidase family protein [Marinimicrobium alkaliphilum]